MKLLQERLAEAAYRFRDKPALLCGSRRLTYRELLARVMDFADVFRARGLRERDSVAILLSDKIDYICSMFGVIMAGGVAVPLMDDSALSTIEEIVRDSGPTLFITSRNDLQSHPFLKDRITCGMFLLGDESTDGGYAERPVMHEGVEHAVRNGSVDDPAVIFFTAGMAVKRTGVVLSHRNLVQATINVNTVMGIDSRIREFVALPLQQSFGFGRVRAVLFEGGTLVLDNRHVNPMTLVENITKYQCDAISAGPGLFGLFFGRLHELLHRIAEQIRYIELGNPPLTLDNKLKLCSLFPNARIFIHYGFSEASRSTILDLRKEQRKLDTAGRSAPNVTIGIADDAGKIRNGMHMGEIMIRGEHVSPGYWNNHSLTTERFTPEGWFRTGDFGFIDDNGYLHVLGHIDEMINLGGMRISPMELEEKIRDVYPDCEICVVGVPDPSGMYGEIPVLCYASNKKRAITPSELEHLLLGRLDRNKIPRIVYRLNSLPPVDDERLLRRELRRRLIEGAVHEIEQINR